MTKYRLYITRMTEEALKAFEHEQYTRANLEYILIYTDKMDEHPFPVAEVTEEAANERLTEAETKWLLNANIGIINREVAKNAPQLLEVLNQKIDVLEKALEDERIKLTEGDVAIDGEQLG